jgi:hypothetical protein
VRVAGHALEREGRPFLVVGCCGSKSNHGMPNHYDRIGHGWCSCGAFGPCVETNRARQQWHREHKEQARGGGDVSDETTADEMDWRRSAWALTHMRLLALYKHDVRPSVVDAIAEDVVAELEQIVRERVAREILAVFHRSGRALPSQTVEALRVAARIARGGAE